MAGRPVDRADLQGNVLAGYTTTRAYYAFVHIADAGTGRRWLGELERRLTTAESVRDEDHPRAHPDDTLNVGLTYEGLCALGLPAEVLASFPSEFREGMGARAELLGDVGVNGPGVWEPGLRPGEPHVLVTITADDDATIARRAAELRDPLEAPGAPLVVVHEEYATALDLPGRPGLAREHFGFADGLAQPAIDDPRAGPYDADGKGTPVVGRRGRRSWKNVSPGEFVLGYPDEDGSVETSIPADPLRENGTYMVVRKLYQDVALFTRYLRSAAAGDPHQEELLAAKIVGRWRDGSPLATCPQAPDPRLAETTDPVERARILNDFRYEDDPHGTRCPIGAHIRRANPRDSLGWGGELSKRHRMIRRGMPYGPPPADPGVDDGANRGLMFVCFQASIERQFEVVQGSWMNDGDAFGLGSDKDPLLGGDEHMGKMKIPGDEPMLISSQPRFVKLRGGGYFFVPGRRALRALAEGL